MESMVETSAMKTTAVSPPSPVQDLRTTFTHTGPCRLLAKPTPFGANCAFHSRPPPPSPGIRSFRLTLSRLFRAAAPPSQILSLPLFQLPQHQNLTLTSSEQPCT